MIGMEEQLKLCGTKSEVHMVKTEVADVQAVIGLHEDFDYIGTNRTAARLRLH